MYLIKVINIIAKLFCRIIILWSEKEAPDELGLYFVNKNERKMRIYSLVLCQCGIFVVNSGSCTYANDLHFEESKEINVHRHTGYLYEPV